MARQVMANIFGSFGMVAEEREQKRIKSGAVEEGRHHINDGIR